MKKNLLGSKGRNVFIEAGAWGRRLQVPGSKFRSKGLRQCGGPSQRPSEGDAVLIQRQQQQDGPAAQQAHVVQQE